MNDTKSKSRTIAGETLEYSMEYIGKPVNCALAGCHVKKSGHVAHKLTTNGRTR